MALAFVKATKIESGSGTSFGGSVSVTVGSLLVSGCVTGYTTIGTGINTTDNSGSNTWNQQDANGTHTFTGTPSKNAYSESSCPNAAGGTYTITLTPQGGSGASGGTASVFEFSGADTTAPKDATSPALKFADPSAAASSNSLTNATANAVFVGMFGGNLASGTSTVTGTSSGWTFPANGIETNATNFYILGMGYKIVSTIAAESAAWTITSQGWGSLIAAYKQASGAAAQNPYQPFPSLPLPILAS